ncbi:MAG TPA: ABC transporter ATP-binding protein [Jiangellaceae bacterium]|nr:ABC transporter ATP-binding protein [Jiangellaceae bacterium]
MTPSHPTATQPVASARSVSRRYGDVVALDDVSLDVHEGSLVGLLGPNGAGKSTLINLFTGLRQPTSGQITLFGADPATPANRRHIGTTPQETGLPPSLRVSEVVDFVAAHFPDPIPTPELLEWFGLQDLHRRQTGGLSGGQKRRLAVALAFTGRPRLVFLDEPTTGLDVDGRHTLWDAIRDYHAGGGTVLLTSHYLEEIEALAERVVVVDRGTIVTDGTTEQVRSTVSVTRLSVTAARLPELPGVISAEHHDNRHRLMVTDADASVRALVHAGTPFQDLEVRPTSLEEAFLALTRQDHTAPTPELIR